MASKQDGCHSPCAVYLEVIGGEGADDLWGDVQAWRARQREVAVQIFAAHSFLHQPVSGRTDSQSVSRTTCRRQHSSLESDMKAPNSTIRERELNLMGSEPLEGEIQASNRTADPNAAQETG